MATLDGIQLFDSAPTSGAAFLLSVSVSESLSISHDGWNVEARGRYVVVNKLGSFAGYSKTWEAAYRAALEALDVASALRLVHRRIIDAETEHLTWWTEGAHRVLRVTFLSTFSAMVMGVDWWKMRPASWFHPHCPNRHITRA